MSNMPQQPWVSYINGRWSRTANGAELEIVDPGKTDRVVTRYRTATVVEATEAVQAAAKAFVEWSRTPAPARAAYVYDLIDLWCDRVDDVAQVVTREMGKSLRESRSEATRAIEEMRYWASEALRLGHRTFESTRPSTEAYTLRQPIGPVAAISPWNFPILSPIRKVIPALVCGCTVVLKPSLQAPGASVHLMQMLDQIGLPAGVANLLVGRGGEIGETLVRHPSIAGVTFTGSTEVGLHIGTLAAERNARVQLEMGGKNAAVVVDYADVEHAADEIAKAAFAVSGQRCTSVSRVIVLEKDRSALEAALVERAEGLTVGHGLDDATDMGPVVNQEQLEKVERYVRLAREGQGHILTGGRKLGGDGYYYAPTIVSGVKAGSPLATEEIFGPVLVIIPVEDFEEAVQVNNEVRYGLASAIFTDDMNLAHTFTRRSQAGMVHINHGTASEGHLPFGGWKDSGQGAYGIGDTAAEFYTAIKAVYNVYRT